MTSISKTLLLSAAVCAVAGTAQAQSSAANICGDPSTEWATGSSETADLSFVPFPMDAEVNASGEIRALRAFRVSAPTFARIEARVDGFVGDPTLTLLNADGLQIDFDDDSGGALNSRLEVELQPGTYCAAVAGFGTETFSAALRIGRMEHDAITEGSVVVDDPTCAPTTEAILVSEGDTSAMLEAGPFQNVASAGSAPFYRFTLAETTPITLTAENPAADPVLRLFNNDGMEIAMNDDFDGLNSRIDLDQGLAAGTYCVSITALGDDTVPIAFGLEAYDEASFLSALYDRGDTAPPLDGSYPVEDLGTLDSLLRRDLRITPTATWISFDMPEDGLALISAVSLTDGDPLVRLFDEFGREQGSNDDSGDDLNALLPAVIGRGTYLLAVTDLGADDGTMRTRLVIERFVPAR
ncbi:MAG: hypothetical protein AAFQ36_00755 [Pseudomonadota bacterium]